VLFEDGDVEASLGEMTGSEEPRGPAPDNRHVGHAASIRRP